MDFVIKHSKRLVFQLVCAVLLASLAYASTPGQQFTSGKKVKVTLDPAPENAAIAAPPGHFEGLIARAEDHVIALELPDGSQITFPPEQVHRAHLKFEW